MRSIVHLSGLHFGGIAPGVLAPLRDRVRRLEPHLVVVSGDLTESARAPQFREARAFLDTLPGPQVVVPGTSDVAPAAWFGPAGLARFRKYVSEDLEPEYGDDVMAVIGANTTQSPSEDATVAQERARRVRARIHGLDARMVKIVAGHEPLLDCGADILLTGKPRERQEHRNGATLPAPSPVIIRAAVPTANGARDDSFAFNALRITSSEAAVERWSWNAHSRRFEHAGTELHPLAQGRETQELPRT